VYWKEWLQTLLGLVIILGMIEMLLPGGELAKFSKLVLGLALMLAVLQPLTILLNRDLQTLELSLDPTLSPEPAVAVLAQKVQVAATMPFLKRDESALAAQVEGVLMNLDYVEDVQVQIHSVDLGAGMIHVSFRPFSENAKASIERIVSSILNVPANQITVEGWAEQRR